MLNSVPLHLANLYCRLRQANPDVPRVREGIKRCSNAYTDIVERLKVSLPVLRNEYITAEELLENNLITEKQRQSLIDEERMYGDADDPCLGLISECELSNFQHALCCLS